MDTLATVAAPDSPKEIKAAIARMLAQMDELREQIKADDAAIARLNASYAVLEAEGRILREESERVMARVRSAF